MIYKKIIFIVLVYGNYDDLERFNESIPYDDSEYKLVVVDSYKDSQLTARGKCIADTIDADFITVENKGYGSGNNAGIEYAAHKYNYDYIFISNPDVEIKKIILEDIGDSEILGPQVLTDSGKNQNPYYHKKETFGFKLLKKFSESDYSFWYYLYLLNHKIIKIIERIISKNKSKVTKVYALHGSFYGMKRTTMERIVPIFNENMFLYSEENHIAELAIINSIYMIYDPNWVVYHHEDGSGSLNNNIKNKVMRKSLKVFFETWY